MNAKEEAVRFFLQRKDEIHREFRGMMIHGVERYETIRDRALDAWVSDKSIGTYGSGKRTFQKERCKGLIEMDRSQRDTAARFKMELLLNKQLLDYSDFAITKSAWFKSSENTPTYY